MEDLKNTSNYKKQTIMIKKDNCILSFIIPVYNVELYIGKCLESITSQINKLSCASGIEVVIVNDGTKDNSMSVVDDYAIKNSYIKIIKQKNRGLSAARNTGLGNAQGKYIWFFDSDDYLQSDSLQSIVDCLSGNYDMYVVDSCCVDERGTIVSSFKNKNQDKSYGFLKSNSFVVWQYIVKRKIFETNGLKFYEGIYHEDIEFTPRMLHYIRTYMVTGVMAYCYLKRTGSTTMGNGMEYNVKRAEDTFVAIKSLNDFHHSLPQDDKKEISRVISLAMNNILQDIPNMSPNTILKIRKLFVENKGFFIHLYQSGIPKYMIESFLFVLFPSLVMELFSILKFKTLKYLKR